MIFFSPQGRKLTDDSDLILGGQELPEGNVNGDTTLTLGLELVKNPSVLEGTLSELSGFLLELLNGTLVNTTALVDQVTGGGRLSGVDVTDDDDVQVSLVFLTAEGKEQRVSQLILIERQGRDFLD